MLQLAKKIYEKVRINKICSIFSICCLLTGCSVTSIFFRDQSYGSFISVESQLMNKNQIPSFIANQNIEKSLVFDSNSYLYCFIKTKNKGNRRAWGVLSLLLDGKEFASIHFYNLPPHMTEDIITIVPVDFQGVSIELFRIKTIWKRLYAK